MLYALSGFVHVATGGEFLDHRHEYQIHRSRIREYELHKRAGLGRQPAR